MLKRLFFHHFISFSACFIIITGFLISKYSLFWPSSELQVFLDHNSYFFKYSVKGGYVQHNGIKQSLLSQEDNKIIDIAVGDIDNDGRDNLLIIEGRKEARYGADFIIYDIFLSNNQLHIREKYRNNLSAINPWTVKICEIDNDNEPEIFIGVHKSTRFYPELENRPFFFNYKDNKLVKKWTGSKLRAPFKNVCFGDLNGNGSDELIVIEETEKGKKMISVYYWFGFGFILQGESKIYESIDLIKTEIIDGNVYVKTNLGYLEPSLEKTENDVYLLSERRD